MIHEQKLDEDYEMLQDAIFSVLMLIVLIALSLSEGYNFKGIIAGFVVLCSAIYVYRQIIKKEFVRVAGVALCYLCLISF